MSDYFDSNSKLSDEILKNKFCLAKNLIKSTVSDKCRGKLILEDLLDTKYEKKALFELGKFFSDLYKYEEAKYYFEKLLSKAENQDDINHALFELGKLEVKNRSYNKAKLYFKQILLNKNNENNSIIAYSILELGKLDVICKQYDEAEIKFKSLLNTTSNNYAKLELGKLYIETHNYIKAKRFFKKIYYNPNNMQDKLYATLELGKVEVLFGNFEKARNYFQQVYSNGNLRDKDCSIVELAKLEYLCNNNEKAIEYLNKASCYNKKGLIYYYLMLVYLKSKNYTEVVNILNYLISNNKKVDIKVMEYICKELNIFTSKSDCFIEQNYISNQILDYDEFVAIDYIEESYIQSNNVDYNIDIYSLFNEISEFLTEETRIQKIEFCDVYAISLIDIGINENGFLKVLTLPNTKKIVSMYKADNKYLIDEEERRLDSSIKILKK